MIICINSINNVWSKWQAEPVSLKFGSETIPIENEPFPSIGICSAYRFDGKKFNFTDVYNSIVGLNENNFLQLTSNE